jgi:hypothetical protein
MKNDEMIRCSICHEKIIPERHGWRLGNNAQPVNDGRCCNDCNAMVVLPERLRRLRREDD